MDTIERKPKVSYLLKGEQVSNFYDAMETLQLKDRGELMAEIFKYGFDIAVNNLSEQKRKEAADQLQKLQTTSLSMWRGDSSRIHLFTIGKKIAVSVQAPNGKSGQSVSISGIRSNAVENNSHPANHHERDYGVGESKAAGKQNRTIHSVT